MTGRPSIEMAAIKLLAPSVAARIAAGEVIDRPAAVVRELVENALDAGARCIEVTIEDAGRRLVAVRDDGRGIVPEDFEPLFQRHATSKIAAADDLFAVDTLGFRGEALYSIAAVADVTLRSTAAGAESGWEIHQRAGRRLAHRPVAPVPGTLVEVRELFFNTPARRKFLKTDATELKNILRVFLPYALVHPGHRFRLRHRERVLLDLPPARTRLERAAAALNLPAGHLLEGDGPLGGPAAGFRLLAGDMNIQRSRADLQFFFVNGRPVQGGPLAFIVNKAFRSQLPAGTWPFFSLELTVPPAQVDVNIHPAKREVRLREERRLTGLLFHACRQLLAARASSRSLAGAVEAAGPPPAFSAAPGQPSPPTDRAGPSLFDKPSAPAPAADGDGQSPVAGLARAAYLGSFRDRYLLFSAPDSLLVLDQHAAHERIAFERLRAQLAAGRVEVQRLLMPVLIRLSPGERLAWETGRGRLAKAGFTTDLWPEDCLAVHSCPALVSAVERAVRDLLAGDPPVRWNDEYLARRACRGAVPAGRPLAADEAAALGRDLAACREPLVCPHGRPTIVALGEATLDRYFRR